MLGVTPAVAADGDLSTPAFANEYNPADYYTLTRVDAAGDNTITKFEYNSATQAFTPVYYRVDLTQTNFGNPAGDTTLTFGWQKNSNGSIEFVENPTNPVGQQITYTYDSSIPNNTQNIYIGNNGGTGIFDSNTEDISGDFINNIDIYIYNISNVNGLFIGNKVIIDPRHNSDVNGIFIGNDWTIVDTLAAINKINGIFIGNTTTPLNVTNAQFIEADFLFNTNHAIMIDIDYVGHIDTIKGNFIGNSSNVSGGAIYSAYNNGIHTISGTFIANNVMSDVDDVQGGAITNTYINYGRWDPLITVIRGNFNNNYTNTTKGNSYGGAIYNDSLIGPPDYYYTGSESGQGILDSKFIGNYARTDSGNAAGGAIYNIGSIGLFNTTTNELTGGIINSSFYNNYAESETGNAKGGAIYSSSDLNIIADNGQSIFSGNKVISSGVEESNAIYMDNSATLNLETQNDGLIHFDDKIDGNDYSIELNGDGTSKIVFNNNVLNADIYTNDGSNTYLTKETYWDGNNLTMNGGLVSFINDAAGVSTLNSLTVSGDTNFVADVDLAAKEMDRFTASEYGSHTGNLNVVGMNLLSDANMDEDVTAVYFAEPGLKDHVANAVGELPGAYQTAYTPIYKYNFIYDTENEYDGKGDGGYFVFTRGDKIPVLPEPEPDPDEPDVPVIPTPPQGGGSTGNPSDAFNPAVLATPVGNLAAGQAAMNEAFKYVFEHADAFTQLPSMERYAKINANKYALSTDFNENMPSYADQLQNKAVWFRPYTTFETMNIKNGPKVDAITYGSLVGFDGDFKEMKNGWSRVFTGYAGYMGSSLNYSGVDTTMNGGLLGFTETFYKGNFWTAITASAGASVGESHTMYGKEDYTSLLAGVGSKTGYNFEFKDGKFIIQPIMFLSYTFVNTFDYKNAAGVNIESDPLHTIQLNPSVRFIANLKGGWQPYASVGMVWNLMNESKVTANNVKLPEMSVKPYVEYGVGVQRNWADKFTAFLQAMIRNGGRNGVALTGGFRFMLGSEPKNSDKPKVKKEIKSL